MFVKCKPIDYEASASELSEERLKLLKISPNSSVRFFRIDTDLGAYLATTYIEAHSGEWKGLIFMPEAARSTLSVHVQDPDEQSQFIADRAKEILADRSRRGGLYVPTDSIAKRMSLSEDDIALLIRNESALNESGLAMTFDPTSTASVRNALELCRTLGLKS